MVLDRNRTSPAKSSSPPKLKPGTSRLTVKAISDFISESAAVGLEKWLMTTFCAPCLEYTPAWVDPNAISLSNFFLNWATLGLALAAGTEENLELGLLYRIAAGVGMLLSMILDCLDGMQARKTGQCSKLGEVLDHALDSISVPISVASVGFGAHMFDSSPVPFTLVLVLSVCVYNAQLVLYHHTGKFIHPDITTGTEGQFGLAVTHVAFGIAEYCLKKNSMSMEWLNNIGWLYCIITCVVSCKVLWFYLVRLYPLKCLAPHLIFHVYTSAAVYLFFTGWLDAVAFSILISVLSFRICGTYVIQTCVKQPFHGYDLACLFLVMMAVLDQMGLLVFDKAFEGTVLVGSRANAFLGCFCVWVVARNIFNLAEHYDALKPKSKASA